MIAGNPSWLELSAPLMGGWRCGGKGHNDHNLCFMGLDLTQVLAHGLQQRLKHFWRGADHMAIVEEVVATFKVTD
ncbi:hypothetical protein GCM10025791_39450 [Halioxenophilus aromaticivorans]|uniref:Uncharacterized protein n=1 Tax=Halioxenophilus aromaticivorans TaxID=1306992 RepID=A0AAV3U7Z0_9ALTE